jgi:hypothetical protein
MIPEDSVLKRHYLTELKSKQTLNFENFMKATEKYKQGDVAVERVEAIDLSVKEQPAYYPFWSNAVLIPLIGFVFMMAVVFL